MARRDRRTTKLVRDALQYSALDVVSAARHVLRDGSRSGNKYVRYNPYRTGIAGKKGVEPPKWDQGTLGGSIFYRPERPETWVEVGTDLAYGKHLEKNGWRWLGLAFDNTIERINLRMRNALRGIR